MTIEYDPAKARANYRKHGVRFADAEQALRDPFGVTDEDPDAVGEQRLVTLGSDSLGHVLVVVHVPRNGRTRIISARKASPNEAQYYAQGI